MQFIFTLPREGLFDFIAELKPICAAQESTSKLVWPDGRELALPSQRSQFKESMKGYQGDLPMDGSFRESLSLRLEFPDDPGMERLDTFDLGHFKAREGYVVANVGLSVEMAPGHIGWLNGERTYVVANVGSFGNRSARVLARDSVQQRFVELAKASRAITLETKTQPYEGDERYPESFLYIRDTALPTRMSRDALQDYVHCFGVVSVDQEALSLLRRYKKHPRLTGHPDGPGNVENTRPRNLSRQDALALADCTRHAESGVRAAACGCLPGFPPRFAVPLLMERLQDSDWRVRATAAELLGKNSGRQVYYQPWNADALAATPHMDNSPFPREQVASALLAALKDPTPEVRISALWALHMLAAPGVVSEILAAMRDWRWQQPEMGVWLEAIRCLPQLPMTMEESLAVLDVFEGVLANNDYPLRRDTAAAIGLL